jgi:energy-coupling factor transporter ATP-binding protein EcfA2
MTSPSLALRIASPFPEGISLETRLRHALVVGKTGSGKSTLLRALALKDMREGRGLLLVDPHGDLAEEVVKLVPKKRRNDLVHFDATTPSRCPGLNPLHLGPQDDRALVVSNVLSLMRHIWPEFWGPRTEHILRNTFLALMDVRGATLSDARDLLVDEKRRRVVLRQVKDEIVREFWGLEFPGYGKQFAAEVTAPVLNKLGALLASGAVRQIVTKRRPRLDMRKLMDRGAIVVASLPKGRIGEDAAHLLGGLILCATSQAALARAEQPTAERRPFFVLVDETGSFATAPLLGLVAEGRKFGVGLALATQSLAAMDPEVRAALLGNAGTLVSFRVGADDADIMSREFVREVAPEHLMRLSTGEMVVREGEGRPVLVTPDG